MMKIKGLGVAAVFLVGCAVGGASSRFLVPAASAQQAATLTKWEYGCKSAQEGGFTPTNKIPAYMSAKMGAEGWEAVMVPSSIDGLWCFKRPKM